MIEFYDKEKWGMKNKDRYEILEEMYIDNSKLVLHISGIIQKTWNWWNN